MEGIVDLTEDDPDSVESMIKFMYKMSFPPADGSSCKFPMRHILDMYLIADKYMLPELTSLAKSMFEDALKRSTKDAVKSKCISLNFLVAVDRVYSRIARERERTSGAM